MKDKLHCQRCDVEGRCANGMVVYWSTGGKHEERCPCLCHATGYLPQWSPEDAYLPTLRSDLAKERS